MSHSRRVASRTATNEEIQNFYRNRDTPKTRNVDLDRWNRQPEPGVPEHRVKLCTRINAQEAAELVLKKRCHDTLRRTGSQVSRGSAESGVPLRARHTFVAAGVLPGRPEPFCLPPGFMSPARRTRHWKTMRTRAVPEDTHTDARCREGRMADARPNQCFFNRG